MTSKGGGLAALEAFEPTPEQLLKLRAKAPRMAPKLDLLVEQFRTDPYYRKNFEAGKYSDPAATFANFVLREETRALDRGIPVPKTSAGRAVQAGSPEAKAAYDE